MAQSITFSMGQAEEAPPAGVALGQWLSGKALPEAASHLGCVRVQLWHCDALITDQPNPEAALRPQRDSAADWVILIEAVSETALQEILPPLEKTLHGTGVTQVRSQGPYQLLTYLRKK